MKKGLVKIVFISQAGSVMRVNWRKELMELRKSGSVQMGRVNQRTGLGVATEVENTNDGGGSIILMIIQNYKKVFFKSDYATLNYKQ